MGSRREHHTPLWDPVRRQLTMGEEGMYAAGAGARFDVTEAVERRRWTSPTFSAMLVFLVLFGGSCAGGDIFGLFFQEVPSSMAMIFLFDHRSE